jgi:hypothetical protein
MLTLPSSCALVVRQGCNQLVQSLCHSNLSAAVTSRCVNAHRGVVSLPCCGALGRRSMEVAEPVPDTL